MNKVARQYVNEVKKHLVCPRQYRNKYLNSLEKNVEACSEENFDASFHDMEMFLGPAQTAAESYVEEISPEVLSTYEQKRKRRKRIAIVGVAVFIVLLISLVTYMSYMHTGYTVTEQTVIYASASAPSAS